MRPTLVAVAVLDALVLASASVAAVGVSGDLAVRVRARPWPARVTPTGPWLHRGGSRKHLADGGDVDPGMSPKGRNDRGLDTGPARDVTMVLRGNFPEVRVKLDIP